jgi:eukaryotic-like serine/threonine-protein kinase
MHAPVPTPTRAADFGDQPQTIRVPIVYPPPTSLAPAVTPPPSADRKLSRSLAADAAGEESGIGLRVGDTFLGFKLVDELGQGAFARVFLAHQQSLAGRPVALKVTLRPTREAERLARLQHTNVVPVYSVHEAPPVQVICMPFLGRRTIADVLRAYRAEHSSREFGTRKMSGTRAARTTDIVESGSGPKSALIPPVAPPRPAAPGESDLIGDPAAVLKVLGQLAAGLAHAHSRGILHLDLKPANVLLPDDGEPMLLDFNLSFDTTNPDRELVGGTVPYMATEQLIDLRTRGRGSVDARTDLYSLGVMAFEMLTGNVPFPASSKDLIDMDGLIEARRAGAPSVREQNPAVSPAVEAIVHKLLAPEPKDRYQSAEELKTDVERHLNDLPLRHARERSLRERFGKWRRRNPGVPARMLAACLLGLVLGLGGAAYQKSEATAKVEATTRARVTRAALDPVRLDLVLPGDPKARARGVAKAEELLAAYGLPGDMDWAKRPEVTRLPESDRAALAGDLGELMLLLAHAKWQEADPKTDPARQEGAAAALKLNRAARTCFAAGAAPALLDRQAAELAFAADEKVEPAAAADRTPTDRDRFLDAVSAMAAGKFDRALALLERVVADQPNHAAGQFCLAYCKQQVGQTERSLERYDIAERLLPGDARPAFQRGVIYGLGNKLEEAEKEYTKVIDLAPDHALAHRNRGFSRFRLGQSKEAEADRLDRFKEAEADLTRALELGAPAYQIHTYRARVRRGLGDEAGAGADERAVKATPPKLEADYVARGMARLNDDPKAALDDFKAAAEINPRSLAALVNQRYILAEKLNQQEAALAAATRLTELYPDHALGRADRAVLLARLGRRAEAHAEAEKARKLSKDPEVTYHTACAYALTSATHPDDRARALALLDRAVKDGFKRVDKIKSDPDLGPIRDSKRFREIEQAADSLFR